MFDNPWLGFITIDHNSRIISANRAAEEFMDAKPGSIAGKRIMDLPFAIRAALLTQYQRALHDHVPARFEKLIYIGKRLRFNLYPADRGVVATVEDVSHEWMSGEAARLALMTVNSLPDAVFTLRHTGHIVNANDLACEITGYAREQLRGMVMSDVLPGLDLGEHDRGGADDQPDEEPGRLAELNMLRRGGTTVPVEVSVARKRMYGLMQYLVIVRDITARRKAEEERDQMFNHSKDLLCIARLDGTFKRVSPSFKDILGWDEGELVDQSSFDFAHPDDQAAVIGKNRDMARGSEAVDFEARFRCKDGFYKWISWNTHTMADKGIAISVGRDVTEHKELEVERELLYSHLAASQKRLESVIENMPAGVMIAVAPSAKIIMGNRQCDKIFGHPYIACDRVSDYIGYVGFRPDGSRVRPHEWPLVRSITQGEVVTGEEIVYRRADGSKRCLLWYSSPIRDEGGEITAAVATFLDITQRKRGERELEEAKAQAELYVDLMGHDINNMHQIALGYLELAREVQVDDGQAEFLEKPIEVLERSARLIQNVRKLQRSKAGGYSPEFYDLGAVIEEVTSRFKGSPDRYVNITAGTVKGVMVEANELLRDVFENLIGNAIKHTTGPAYVNIRMNREHDGDGRRHCLVTVEDNGPGIPDGLKQKIFDRLHRGETRARGSGLGLYLVRSLVESYGGTVWVEDRVPGDRTKGAKFVVMLPVAELSQVSELPET